MSAQLELRFEPDTDGTGELFAFVYRDTFAGSGSAWFNLSQVETFGASLANTFPIPKGAEISLEGGYWQSGVNPPRLKEVLLGLRVYSVNATGSIGIHVEVMEGQYDGQREESRSKLSIELLTEYESIRRFGLHISHMLHSPGAAAILLANAA
jgi:hypothetical protein